MSFDEDRSRLRKEYGAENLAVLRHIALNLLTKHEKSCKRSIRGKRLLAGWDHSLPLKVLAVSLNFSAFALANPRSELTRSIQGPAALMIKSG